MTPTRREVASVPGMTVGDHTSAHQQGRDIGRADVVTDATTLLGPMEQHLERPLQLALDSGVDFVVEALLCQLVGQVALPDGEVDQFGHEREHRRTGVRRSAQLLGPLHQGFQPVHDDRLEQRLFSREVAVDSTYTHPGAAGDLVDRHGQAFGGKYLFRRPQDLVHIAARVRPQRTVRLPRTIGRGGDRCHI